LAVPEPLPSAPQPLADLLPRAIRQRPEAEALRQNVAAAEAGTQLARSGSKPRINLEAGYALQTKTALTDTNNVFGGVSISAPLFDGPNRRADTRTADERLAQARDGLKALEGGIALELEQQRLAMEEARARRELADQTVAAAQKAYDITRARLELGRAVQVEILNSRLNLERALGDRVAAENDLRVAWARLQRALGEGPIGADADRK
jgi:outer membrane protein